MTPQEGEWFAAIVARTRTIYGHPDTLARADLAGAWAAVPGLRLVANARIKIGDLLAFDLGPPGPFVTSLPERL